MSKIQQEIFVTQCDLCHSTSRNTQDVSIRVVGKVPSVATRKAPFLEVDLDLEIEDICKPCLRKLHQLFNRRNEGSTIE